MSNKSELSQLNLKYLTTIERYKEMQDKNIIKDTYDEDFNFYKKRILILTNKLFNNKNINNEIDLSFKEYVNQIIKYFKFIDKKDIIQSKYPIKNEKIKLKKKLNVMNLDKLILKQNEIKKIKKINTLDNFIHKDIKIKKKKEYPKIMTYNIKDPKYKN